MDNTLNGDQGPALAFLESWHASDSFEACLQGYAGVGKTWLLGYWLGLLLEKNPNLDVCIAAPTHKALDVLREKCGHLPVAFKTVASLLGQHISRNEDGEVEKRESPTRWKPDLVVCDEASMVDKESRRKLLEKRWRILWSGDPAQLPPINEVISETFNCDHKFLMSQVLRYADTSPVADVATMLRNRFEDKLPFDMPDVAQFYNREDRRLCKVSHAKVYDWLNAAIDRGLVGRLLAYTNDRVLQHNRVMHEMRFPGTPLFGVGEQVMLNDMYVMNPHPDADPDDDPVILTNGMTFVVKSCEPIDPVAGVRLYRCELVADRTGQEFTLDVAQDEMQAKSVFKMLTEAIWKLRKTPNKTMAQRDELHRLTALRKPLNMLAPLRCAYSCTVHKSQGSTYDVSMLDWDNMMRCQDRAQIMYVGATRTRNYLVIVE